MLFTSQNDSTKPITREIEQLLRSCLSRLSKDVATFTIDDTELDQFGLIFSVKPKNSKAASIEIRAQDKDRQVDVQIAEAYRKEFFFSKNISRRTQELRQLRELIEATLEGRVEEDLVYKDEQLVGSQSRVDAGSGAYSSKQKHFGPKLKEANVSHKYTLYEPY